MQYVYILQSAADKEQRFVGVSNDLNDAITEHNTGLISETAPYKPWQIILAMRFANHLRARNFADYLKKPQGKAYARKHFW